MNINWAPTTIESSWSDLLGTNRDGMTQAERRARWATWLKLARNAGNRAGAAMWGRGYPECHACAHRRGGWCNLQALPCTVNPILTIRHGWPGMACMGTGFRPRQLELL